MDIKYKLYNIGIYTTLTTAILGGIIFYIGLDRSDLTFIIIGLAVLTPSIIWAIIWNKKQKREEISGSIELENLKKTADKIIVNLNTAEIKTNSWTEDKIIETGRIGMLNQLGGDGDKNIRSVTRNESMVSWVFNYHGKTIHYTIVIDKEVQSLKMHFAIQKETILYVDPNNPDNNYLDLEFLQ
jgi:hypothetical protein